MQRTRETELAAARAFHQAMQRNLTRQQVDTMLFTLPVRVTRATHQRLKARAAAQGVSMAHLVRTILGDEP